MLCNNTYTCFVCKKINKFKTNRIYICSMMSVQIDNKMSVDDMTV